MSCYHASSKDQGVYSSIFPQFYLALKCVIHVSVNVLIKGLGRVSIFMGQTLVVASESMTFLNHGLHILQEVAESVKEDFGTIDILVHSLANGPEVSILYFFHEYIYILRYLGFYFAIVFGE